MPSRPADLVSEPDSTVNVTGGGAGGVQVAGGGTLYGNNLTVTSASKAAIRSDRGGGIMVIDGGTYTSEGSSGCPVIYSTADITVKNAVGVSEQSRAVIIEGKNSVSLENCTLTGNDQSTKSGSIRANVLLYQSASGDAKEGTSVFSMTGGKMISQSGAMFYCTNTSSVVNLRSAELVLSDTGDLLIVSAGRWGKDGKNGGKCVFNAEDQTLEGNITVDSISSIELNLKNSTYKGAIANEGKVTVIGAAAACIAVLCAAGACNGSAKEEKTVNRVIVTTPTTAVTSQPTEITTTALPTTTAPVTTTVETATEPQITTGSSCSTTEKGVCETPTPTTISEQTTTGDTTVPLTTTTTPATTTVPAPAEPYHGQTSGDYIYVNGFGWVFNEGGGGEGSVNYEMYCNGNKIGYFG